MIKNRLSGVILGSSHSFAGGGVPRAACLGGKGYKIPGTSDSNPESVRYRACEKKKDREKKN